MLSSYPVNFRPIGAMHDNAIEGNKDNLMLYRSADLSRWPGVITSLCNHLAVESIIDLRSIDEVTNSGLVTDKTFDYQSFPLLDEGYALRNSNDYHYKNYSNYYFEIYNNNLPLLINIIKYMANSSQQRFILFCYAGKDRTGILSAIILKLLGLADWVIYSDYSFSSSYLLQSGDLFAMNWRKRNITQEMYFNRFKTDPRALVQFFALIQQTHGDMQAHLLKNGLLEADLIKLNVKFSNHIKLVTEAEFIH